MFTPNSLLAQWELINVNETITSFDMLTTRIGLVGMTLHLQSILARYDSGTLTGFTNTLGPINSIVVRDTDVAYLSIEGDGIYRATNHWSILTKLVDADQSSVLCVRDNTVIALVNGSLKCSLDGTLFFTANGTEPLNPVTAVEAITSKLLIGVGGNLIYRSINSGATWTTVLDTSVLFNSVYIDTARQICYAGGSGLLRSLDNGLRWDPISSLFFTPLSGAVIGSRDCSGTFYLGPDSTIHGELYRSINQGKFFQNVGPAFLSSTKLKKAVVLDRGSTIFWLNKSDLLSVTHIGIDSAIPDLVRDRVIYKTDTTLHSSLCINAPVAQGTFSLSYDQCTGIFLDSLIPTPFNPAFSISFRPQLLTDTTLPFTITFKAKQVGLDSGTFRIRYHSPTTQNVENVIFTVHGFGETSGAFLSLPKTSVEFGTVGVDSVRKRTITFSNLGCDTLMIDSIVTSSKTYFPIDEKIYPIPLLEGKNYSFEVRFTPNAEGEYLEAITLATSLGTRYITLHGFAAKNGSTDTTEESVVDTKPHSIKLFPNPAHSSVLISGIEQEDISDLTVIDVLGNRHSPVILNRTDDALMLDLSSLPPGNYLIMSSALGLRQKIIRY
jgi:hypothetical protein